MPPKGLSVPSLTEIPNASPICSRNFTRLKTFVLLGDIKLWNLDVAWDGIESPTRGESSSSKKKDNSNQGKCSCCNLLKKDRVNDFFGPVTNEYCEGCHCPKGQGCCQKDGHGFFYVPQQVQQWLIV